MQTPSALPKCEPITLGQISRYCSHSFQALAVTDSINETVWTGALRSAQPVMVEAVLRCLQDTHADEEVNDKLNKHSPRPRLETG